jgi:hypothetical protein
MIELILFDKMGSDKTIAEAAWTSTISQKKKETKSDDDVRRVVQMLIRDLHTSPLESVVMTFKFTSDVNGGLDTIMGDLKAFKHLVMHKIDNNSALMTLNFHALMKYRKAHLIFNSMFDKVKEEGFVKHCIDQIEAMEK